MVEILPSGRFRMKKSFRYTQWMDGKKGCEYWFGFFKEKSIPTAIIRRKNPEIMGKFQYAVFREGVEQMEADKYPESYRPEWDMRVVDSANDFTVSEIKIMEGKDDAKGRDSELVASG